MKRRATIALLFSTLIAACLLVATKTSTEDGTVPMIILVLIIIPLSVAIPSQLR